MHRTCLAVLALSLSGLAASAAPTDRILPVIVDQATVAQLPENTATVIIGNPAIADVTTLKKNSLMVVTGKGYGRTNLIVLDSSGAKIDEMQIHVQPTRNVLVVQRGDSRVSYSCDPVCMPSAVLGDDSKVFGDVTSQVTAHDQFSGRTGK
jgi:Flp pilus assembly secretin CpaC